MIDECEENLATAMPIMKGALSALDTLKTNDIAILKSMTNPPLGVKLVLEAVCILHVPFLSFFFPIVQFVSRYLPDFEQYFFVIIIITSLLSCVILLCYTLKGLKPLMKVDQSGKQYEEYWPIAKKVLFHF